MNVERANEPDWENTMENAAKCDTACELQNHFVVAGTPNAGFNVVLTALLNLANVCGALFIVTNSKAPIA
ncbi:unnamed protein product, partial [Sphagnum compactum]